MIFENISRKFKEELDNIVDCYVLLGQKKVKCEVHRTSKLSCVVEIRYKHKKKRKLLFRELVLVDKKTEKILRRKVCGRDYELRKGDTVSLRWNIYLDIDAS